MKNGVAYITLKLSEQELYGKLHVRARRGALCVKTTQNSTGGTGAHSAGKLTKTEVNGKEDS